METFGFYENTRTGVRYIRNHSHAGSTINFYEEVTGSDEEGFKRLYELRSMYSM